MQHEIPQEALDQMEKEGWASPEQQLAYWTTHDHGGNVLPDRIQANLDMSACIYCGKDAETCEHNERDIDWSQYADKESDSERNH